MSRTRSSSTSPSSSTTSRRPADSSAASTSSMFIRPSRSRCSTTTVVTFGSVSRTADLCPSAVHARADLGLHSGDRQPGLGRPLAQAGRPAGRDRPVGRGTRLGRRDRDHRRERRGLSPARSARIERSRAPPVREACHCETSDRRSGVDALTTCHSVRFTENTLSNRCSAHYDSEIREQLTTPRAHRPGTTS